MATGELLCALIEFHAWLLNGADGPIPARLDPDAVAHRAVAAAYAISSPIVKGRSPPDTLNRARLRSLAADFATRFHLPCDDLAEAMRRSSVTRNRKPNTSPRL